MLSGYTKSKSVYTKSGKKKLDSECLPDIGDSDDRKYEVDGPYEKMIESSRMTQFVCWSGGIDSTLILIDLIKKGIHPKIITFTCDIFGGSQMREFESSARTNILQYLAKEYSYEPDIFDYSEISMMTKNLGSEIFGKSVGLVQQPYMMSMISLFCSNNTCVHMGYHLGDDFWTYSYDIISAQKHFMRVEGGKHIEFSFPLKNMTKADIILKLKEYKFPIDLCTYCYNPTYSGRCGHCDACKRFDSAMVEITMHKKLERDLIYEPGILPEPVDKSVHK